MAKSGKKQGGKNKAAASKKVAVEVDVEKKTTAKNTADKKTTAKKTTAKKKPASFSRSATAKSSSKKTTAKKTTSKKTATKSPKKTTKETSSFAEFETLKLGEVEKLDSKIIVRDVAREKPINRIQTVSQPAMKPIDRPKPVVRQTAISPKPTARDIKEQEIAKAIRNASSLPTPTATQRKRKIFGDFGLKRVILATACITTAIFAALYFVNLTSTDMSLKVAAMQSGINAVYPSFVPRGYELSDVTSSSGKISMHFKSSDGEFGISEETSSWDSEALLGNYIKVNYGDEYTVVREQGLTLYMGDTWEAWVNGGMLYKLNINSGSLTKKQMKSIATSL